MSGLAHFAHFVMTLLTGGLWLVVWILFALMCGSSKRDKMIDLQKENNDLLRRLNERNWK